MCHVSINTPNGEEVPAQANREKAPTQAEKMTALHPSDFHPYQEKAVRFLNSGGGKGLFLDCGLGKTISTLTALHDLFNSFDACRVLVVAPKRVCEEVWEQESKKWSHVDGLTFNRILGTPTQRTWAYQDRADIHLVNYENLVWLIENTSFEYDTVVFDELSKMKSPSSKRFKAFKKVRHQINNVFGLTATPASNGLLDLWAQVYCLDMGERLGKTFSSYRDRYFESDYMGYNFTPKKGAEEKIYKRISDICLSMSAEEYLKLPDVVKNYIPVKMPAKARRQYEELEKQYLLDIEDETIVVQSAATLTNKLLQFCNGSLYIDEQQNYAEVHDAKLEALDSIVQESGGEPLLVAYNFKKDKQRILNKFGFARDLNSDNVVKDWNAGKVRMLLVHPASGGHGLNIQTGGSNLVWYGLNWSLELYYQLNKRLDRQGQTKPVFIHHIVCHDSVDERVIKALEDKTTTQDELLRALKNDIENRANKN